MKARLTLTLILVALVGLALYLGRPASPTRAVLQRLDRLQEVISKHGDEGGAGLATKTLGLEALFTSPCEVTVGPVSGRYEAEELSSLALRYRSACRTIDLSFSNLKIQVDGDRASADFTAHLALTEASGQHSEDRQLHALFLHKDRDWRITKLVEVGAQPSKGGNVE